MAKEIRCHYEVLSVERDADAATIKKAHRKLALKYHPDKNQGCKEAEHEFRLVQEAYETLSDPQERKWYDQHREAILNGGKGFDDADGEGGGISFIFDVLQYHTASCYDGYGDDEDGFYATYQMVFQEIMKGEQSGWISEGNIDEEKMHNYHLLSVDFGNSTSDWSDVSEFYAAWEGFSSCLSFAWADQYDPRDAPNRFVRRRIDEENRKARKVAKRERNDDVLALVHFVKRRDPRVKEAKERAERERKEKEANKALENERKKKETAAARKEWREQAELEMAEAEAADTAAGRVRLADLDDSDDDFYGGRKQKKGKGGKKKGRKNKKNRNRWSSDEEDDGENKKNDERSKVVDDSEQSLPLKDQEGDEDVLVSGGGNEESSDNNQGENISVSEGGEEMAPADVDDADNLGDEGANNVIYSSEEESESSSEEEPDFWRCECCRKDFKSEKQLENHIKSKKHREAWKKDEKKLKKEATEKQLMEEVLDEIDDLEIEE